VDATNNVTQHEAFRILNVGDGSSPAEIREAYLDLLDAWDPYRFGTDQRLLTRAKRALQDISEAYSLLRGEADAISDTSSTTSPGAPNAPVGAAAEEPLQHHSEVDDEPEAAEESGGTPLIQLVLTGVAADLAVVALGTTLMFRTPPADATPASQLASPPPAVETPLSIAAAGTSGAAAAVEAPAASEAVTTREGATDVVDSGRPTSGIEMVSPRRTGGGSLVIYNRERRDAVVALTRARVFERAVYIRAGEEVELANIAAGTYRVVMTLGRDWAMDRFDRNSSFRELNKPAHFIERANEQGTDTPVLLWHCARR